jgi:kynureninase
MGGDNVPAGFKRSEFILPDGLIYLDGNSLGALPVTVPARVEAAVAAEWGQMLIRGWNQAGWIDLPARVAGKIARLIGVPDGAVMVGDSTSVNVFKVLNAALDLMSDGDAGRNVILSDTGNFPTDLYIAQGVTGARSGWRLKIVDPAAVAVEIDETVAVLMLTEVDYRTGRLHDMAALTAAAHRAGALTIWDLAHSAGALPIDLTGTGADFAVGCGYKYLNGGPGAPAFAYVRPDHADRFGPRISGWFGHEAPFAFDQEFRPAKGIQRMTVGTPPVLSLSALDTALDLWADVDLHDIRDMSIALSQMFITEVETRCAGHGLSIASPRAPERRGSQVSFQHAEGYAVMQALIAANVIGDFRAPDIIRFGFAPLYNSADDVLAATENLARILHDRIWDRPEFKTRAKVT